MDSEDLRFECMKIALTRGGYVLTEDAGVQALTTATNALVAIVFGRTPKPNTPAEASASASPDKPEDPAPVQARKPGRQ